MHAVKKFFPQAPAPKVPALNHATRLYQDARIADATPVYLQGGYLTLRPKVGRFTQPTASDDSAVAANTKLFSKSLEQRRCIDVGVQVHNVRAQTQSGRLTVADFRHQQSLLDLIDVAMGQSIDGQRAWTLVKNAFLPDQPAPTEDLISRAAKLMAEAPQLHGTDAWKAVALEPITADDFQSSTALDGKQSALATNATASQRWRVMYPIAAPIAAEPAPVAVSLIADGFQNWGQLVFGGTAKEQYLQAMSVVPQMDDLAAKGDPSFTQDEANQRKFQLIAFAEQFVARDHKTPAKYIDFPPSEGITARFKNLMRWVASCKSSDRATYLPTRAALPLVRQMLEGQENFDYHVFVHGVMLAGAAPQLDKREVRALTTQLERALLDLPQLPAKHLQSSFEALRAMANKVEPAPPTSQHSSLPRLDELERRISSYMEAAINFDEEIAVIAALPPAAELEPAIEY